MESAKPLEAAISGMICRDVGHCRLSPQPPGPLHSTDTTVVSFHEVQMIDGWIPTDSLCYIPFFYSRLPRCVLRTAALCLSIGLWSQALGFDIGFNVAYFKVIYMGSCYINNFTICFCSLTFCFWALLLYFVTLIPFSYYIVLNSMNMSHIINSLIDI